jgi:anti-anti-sigma factor
VTPLRITTDVDGRGVAILAVTGQLRVDAAERLAATIAAALTGNRVTRLVVDFARVSFLDVTAVSSLLQARAAALQAGASFRIIRPQRPVRRVLHLTDTCQLLTVGPAPSGHRAWAPGTGR